LRFGLEIAALSWSTREAMMQKDDGTLVAISVVGALTAGAFALRGSRSVASQVISVASVASAPVPGARVAAGVLAFAFVISRVGKIWIKKYLKSDSSNQIKMLRRAAMVNPGTAAFGLILLKDPTRAKRVAGEVDSFLREYGEDSIQVASELAHAMSEAKVAHGAMRGSFNEEKAPVGSTVREEIDSLRELLSSLQAARLFYHSVHWRVRGSSFYGDHLLFQRLYEGEGGGPNLDDQIDALAEKMVAKYGPQSVQISSYKIDSITQPSLIAKIEYALEDSGGKSDCPFRQAIEMEKSIQNIIRYSYNELKNNDSLSLGMDDFLMSLASERETAMYLLKQRVDSSKISEDGGEVSGFFRVRSGSSNNGSLRVLRSTKRTVGSRPRDLMESISRGRLHDPRKVRSVEVVLEGTREELLSQGALHFAQAEARRLGLHGGRVQRIQQPQPGSHGKMTATYLID